MDFSIQSLASDHREIERALEGAAESVATGMIDLNAFRCAQQLCARHYEREEAFLVWLGQRDAALAGKLRGQHDEAMDCAAHLFDASAADQTRDSLYLARRFLAIARHNIIEEERDVFPLAATAG